MAASKTWTEKLRANKEPKVKRIDAAFADIPAHSIMFIATPQLINHYIKQIPKGKKVSVQTMRKDLALENKAEYTCPVTTGIFLRIVAEANFELYQQTNSLKGITPFWRVIEPNSALSKKLSFGQDLIIKQQKLEKIVG
ncbi:MAG: hypothetical protein ACRCYO_16380 [Bacteroidia bacterium]